MITEVSPENFVTLDGSGNGSCYIAPPSGSMWRLRLAAVRTSGVAQPSCTISRGSQVVPLQPIDFTLLGNGASSGKVAGAPFFSGQALWASWTGGTPGARATLIAYGQQGQRGDPFEITPIGEGFDLSVANQVIIGAAGGPRAFIGSPLPPELIAYYSTRLGTIANFGILLYPNATDYHYELVGTGLFAPDAVIYAEGAVVGGVVTEFRNEFSDPGVFGGTGTQFNSLAVAGNDHASWTFGFDIMSGGAGQNQFYINQADIRLGAIGGLDTGSLNVWVASILNKALTAKDQINIDTTTGDLRFATISAPRGFLYSLQLAGSPIVTAAVATETLITQTGVKTYVDGRVYRWTYHGPFQPSVANTIGTVFLRRGVGIAGSIRLQWQFPMPNAGAREEKVLTAVAAAPAGGITQNMAMSVLPNAAGTIAVYATGGGQGQIECVDVGSINDYPATIPTF